MSQNSYIQQQASASRQRSAVIVKAAEKTAENESPMSKHYRLAVAMFREFVKEYPDKAVEIVNEMVRPDANSSVLVTTRPI